jgi:hypothetical protein
VNTLTLVIEQKGRPFAELAFDGDLGDARDIGRMRQAAADEIVRRGYHRDYVVGGDFTLVAKDPGGRTTQVALR